jgi:bifunctional non-homologous end joining protein LigD
MIDRFVVHHHRANRPHFDVRLIQKDNIRSWSLLKEPPCRIGVHRLAIERESLLPQEIDQRIIVEEAFGPGRADIWDEGEVEVVSASSKHLSLRFEGTKLRGRYELSRMRWYPGNRWLFRKRQVE